MNPADTDADPLAPDRVPGLLHPRETQALVGHEAAVGRAAAAIEQGKPPSGWLVTGPRGIGKATFCYHVARTLLKFGAGNADTADDSGRLQVDPEDAVFRQVAAGSHPNLIVLKRTADATGKKLRKLIPIEEVRRLSGFFGQHAAVGGWRVCIIDCADELGVHAANALLKTLEEPPARSLFLLISHAPGRLLPTIRSRCQRLDLMPLDARAMDLFLTHHAPTLSETDKELAAALSGGAPGRALELAAANGLDTHRDLMKLMIRLPAFEPIGVYGMAQSLAVSGGEEQSRQFVQLLSGLLARLARAASGAPNAAVPAAERDLIVRLTERQPNPIAWLDIRAWLEAAVAESEGLNLDRRHLVQGAFQRLALVTGHKAA